MGRTEDAIKEYQAVLKLKPDYVAARRALADLLLKSHKPDAALLQLREILKRTPRNTEINEQVGDLEKSLGHTGAALDAYQAALQNAPSSKTRKRIQNKMKLQTGAATRSSRPATGTP